MLIEIVAAIFTLILFTFLGYSFHWMFHQRWSGRFYTAHYNHHHIQYPINNFSSDSYRYSGKDSTVWLFGLCFAPIIAGMIAITVLHVVSLFLGLSILVEMAFIGWLNNSLHDNFHLTKSFWQRFWFFDKLVSRHKQHHINTNTNLGIFSFVWDKILGTFKE